MKFLPAIALILLVVFISLEVVIAGDKYRRLVELEDAVKVREAEQWAPEAPISAKPIGSATENLSGFRSMSRIKKLSPWDGSYPTRQTIFQVLSQQEFLASQRDRLIKASSEYLHSKDLKKLEAIQLRYGLFAQLASVESDKASDLFRLLNEKENLPDDLNAVAEKTGYSVMEPTQPGGRSFFSIVHTAELDRLNSEIKELLGAENYARYQDFERNVAQHLLVQQMQQAIDATESRAFLSSNQIQEIETLLLRQREDPDRAIWPMFPVSADDPATAGNREGYRLSAPLRKGFVAATGSIYSAVRISNAMREQLLAILNRDQNEALDGVLSQQATAEMLAAHNPP